MVFLALMACILVGVAAYNLTCAFVDVPTSKTSKMMMFAKKQQGIRSEKLHEVYITKIATKLAPFIHLDKLKRDKLQSVLSIAGIPLSPEVYTLRAYVTASLIVLAALLMAVVMPLSVPILIGLAVAMWFSTYYSAFDFVKKRKKVIEAEIPRFALTIAQNLENDRDVLKILAAYRRVAGKEFGMELDQTVADMKTGNYENALIRFESRIGSTMLSDVVRGLIGTLRGDDQRMYFRMITFDMRQIEQANLKKEAAKRPKKIQRYSMMMLFCIVIIYLVVLSTEVLGLSGGLLRVRKPHFKEVMENCILVGSPLTGRAAICCTPVFLYPQKEESMKKKKSRRSRNRRFFQRRKPWLAAVYRRQPVPSSTAHPWRNPFLKSIRRT